MATVTKDVSNLDELKAALQSAASGDTLNINITKDITVGQPALPAPRAWVATRAQTINIYGNSHTISGINLPSQVYSKSLIYFTYNLTSKLYIHDIKILNALCVDTPLAKGEYQVYIYLYNSTITGNFNLFFESSGGDINQCNISITTGHAPYFQTAQNSHIYVGLLTPSAAPLSGNIVPGYTNSYIEINDKFGALNFDKVSRLLEDSTNSCINLTSNVSGTINNNSATKGVSVFNTTHAPNITSTAAKLKGITDDQMKNADYLNSIGFAVNETN